MSERRRTKTYKYALVLFISTEEVGIVKTSQIKGLGHTGKDSHVEVQWTEGEEYLTRILDLADNELCLKDGERDALNKLASGSLINDHDRKALEKRNRQNLSKIPASPIIPHPAQPIQVSYEDNTSQTPETDVTKMLTMLDTKINKLITNQTNILSILNTLQTHIQETTHNTHPSTASLSFPSFSEMMQTSTTAQEAQPAHNTPAEQPSFIFPQLIPPLQFPFSFPFTDTNRALSNIPSTDINTSLINIPSTDTNTSLINIPSTDTNTSLINIPSTDCSANSFNLGDIRPQTLTTSTPAQYNQHQRPAYFPDESFVSSLYQTTSKLNFCVKLLKCLYPDKDDLAHCSVNGGGPHKKRPLNICARNYLKDTYFQFYSTPEADKDMEWKKCTNALNAFLCKYVNKKS